MVHIRTYSQLEALDLTQAENELIKASCAGTACSVADGELPSECDNTHDDRRVRASILRYLLLGGCQHNQVPICTINLCGAYITGTLDLDQQRLKNSIVLSKCRISDGLSVISPT